MNTSIGSWMRSSPATDGTAGAEAASGRGRTAARIAFLLVLVPAFLGCAASEEIAGPGSPLYRSAVESAIAEQHKGEAQADERLGAAQPQPPRRTSEKDVAILDFIARDMAASAATPSGVRTVYVHWTEDHAEFRRTPPRPANAAPGAQDCYVYLSNDTKKFMQVSLARSGPIAAAVPRGWGLVLSRADRNVYVYWCPGCKACHMRAWRLTDSDEPAPVEELPANPPDPPRAK